jgi:hypothetical protein
MTRAQYPPSHGGSAHRTTGAWGIVGAFWEDLKIEISSTGNIDRCPLYGIGQSRMPDERCAGAGRDGQQSRDAK